MSEPREDDFASRTKLLLDGMATIKHADSIDAAFKGLGPRRFGWRLVFGVALAAAALAALVTWSGSSPGVGPAPAAFDGGIVTTPPADPDIKRDARGRIAEIAVYQTADGTADGERLIFRAGRLLRIEHWRGARLDGIVVDLDGSGRVVRIETWAAGERVGPNVELDPELKPRAPQP